MKAVLIVHNAAIDGEVNDLLSEVGVDCYTKLPNALGRGQLSVPHMNTAVWPGVNTATLVVVEESNGREIMKKVRLIREKLGSEGVKAFMWEIEEVT